MSDPRPNILFLFSDQHNARCLSCAGHPEVQTPQLDRLASEGVRFTNAYAQNAICTPSRMTILSGCYSSVHGYYGLYGREPDISLTSMFEYFGEHGYRTGALGKLHTPRYWIERHCQFVYDEFIEYPKYLEGAGLYDRNDGRGFMGPRNGVASPLPFEHSCEMALAKQAVRFLRNQGEPKDRAEEAEPWMAWVSFSRPHGPLTPSEPYASLYPPDHVELPPTSETECPRFRRMRRENSERYDEETLRQNLSAYLGLCTQVDAAMEVVLEELERLGVMDNTIIVYTADHGDFAGEHGLWEKVGGISSRAVTRVPLIVRYPRSVVEGLVRSRVVETIDIFPTFCELAGLPVSDHLQGRSFVPLLGDDPERTREDALTENSYRKALATERFRFVANIGDESDELYDVENDPWELHNLIDDPDYAEVASRMLRRTLERVVRARRPVTNGHGGWHNYLYDRDGRFDRRARPWDAPFC